MDSNGAQIAIRHFAALLKQTEADAPGPVGALRTAWQNAYGTCGHKALGRVLIGRTVDEVCKAFEREGR